jgi:hypothetical protein
MEVVMVYKNTAVLLVLALFLAGCSSMSKKECVNADWYSIGLQDGRGGSSSSKVSGYAQTCGKHDISISQSDYLAGHSEGIRYFCQPDTGYSIGLSGRSLPQVCPSDLKSAFSNAHAKGFAEFKIKRDIKSAESKFSSAVKTQNSIESKLVDAVAVLYSKGQGDEKASAQESVNQLNTQIRNSVGGQVTAVGQLACASGDWYRAGTTDGEAGRSGGTYKRHVRQCQTYHPATNQSDYIKGQSAGLQRYCTFDNGVMLGRAGRELSTLCQGESARDLKAGHARGLDDYNEKVTIAGLTLRKADLEKQVKPLAAETKRLESELAKGGLSSEAKLSLTRKIRNQKLNQSKLVQSLEATTNELNCYVADWEVFGFKSAEKGEVFKNQSLNCSTFGISVNTQSYKTGYDLGLTQYCTAGNGRTLGAVGHEYLGICPNRLEADFLDGYLPAYKTFKRAQLKKELTTDLKQTTNELNRVKTEIDLLAQDLDRDGISRAEKLAIINEMSELNRRENSLASDTSKMSAHLQCLADNWQLLGQKHGSQGLSSQLRVLNCTRFDETPDTSDYRNGLSRGLKTWCTQEKGYAMAIAESDATPACSRNTHREYYRGYQDGLSEIQRRKEIDALKVEKLDIIEGLPKWQNRILEIDTALASGTLSNTSVRRLRSEKLTLQKKVLDKEIRLEEINLKLGTL